MQSSTRRKIEMAERVLEFLDVHPFAEPAHQALVDALATRTRRLRELAVGEVEGRRRARAGVTERRRLRRLAQRGPIRVLERVGELAALEHPEFEGVFRGPATNASHAAFLARGRQLVDRGRAEAERLAPFGLVPGIVPELDQLLGRFAAAGSRVNTGRRGHVGARAGLRAIAGDLLHLIGVLDALVGHRFRDDAEQLGAWASARNLPWPRSRAAGEPAGGGTPPEPGQGPDLGQAA